MHCTLGNACILGQGILLYLISLGNLQQCFEWTSYIIRNAFWTVWVKKALESTLVVRISNTSGEKKLGPELKR